MIRSKYGEFLSKRVISDVAEWLESELDEIFGSENNHDTSVYVGVITHAVK